MGSIDRVVFVEPNQLNEISFNGKNFDTSYNKKAFIGSRVSYNDVILHSFKVPATTTDEELSNLVEIRIYEDAGLDLQKKYKIAYTKKELDFEENFLIEAFAIEVEKISEFLANVVKKTKYIDFLALPFLSFSTLYKNKIIASKNDIFIYFGENDAFLSIYKDGKYLSSKGIANLEDIAKQINSAGFDITADELLEVLSTKGLDAKLYERGESILYNQLESEFAKIFTKINDIVIYNRSVFGFEKIDRIFLSTKNGRIKGMKEFILNFGFNEVQILDFNLFKQKFENNFLDYIVTSYIYDKAQLNDNRHNLSIFPREAPFYKKQSGQLIISAFGIVALAVLYVVSLSYEIKSLEIQKIELQKRYDELKNVQNSYKKKIVNVKKELEELNSEDKNLDERLKNITSSVGQLEDLIKAKSGYSDFLIKVNTLLKKYNLATTKITLIEKDKMEIEIVAQYSKRDNITKFMEDLIKRGFIGVRTDEIKSDKDIYISKIEIKR